MGLRPFVGGCILACACGRLDFSSQGDAGAPGDFVISATQLVMTSEHSFSDLAVDWTRSLAYASTRESGQCLDVIDFASAPTLLNRIAPPQASGDNCLGVSLDASGTNLLVSSYAAGKVERWDLGADPRAAAYTRQIAVAVPEARRLRRRFGDPTQILAALGKARPGFQILQELPASPWLSVGPAFASTLPCPDQLDDVNEIATGVVLTGCSTNNSPLEIVNPQSMAVVGTIDATPPDPTEISGFASAVRTSDGKLGAALGWVSIIVDTSGPSVYTTRARFDNDSTYRQAEFIDRGRGVELVGARGDANIEILSLADPSTPRVTARGSVGVVGELYGISVAPDATRALAVSNAGWVFLVDLSRLPPADQVWPAF